MEHDLPERTPPNRWIAALVSAVWTSLAAVAWLCLFSALWSIGRALIPPPYRVFAAFVAMVATPVAMPRLGPIFRKSLTDRDRELLTIGSFVGAALGLLFYMMLIAVANATPQHPASIALLPACMLGTSVVTAYLLGGNGPSFRRQA